MLFRSPEKAPGREALFVTADEVVVERDDGEHGNRAQTVEPGQVPQGGRTLIGGRVDAPRSHSFSSESSNVRAGHLCSRTPTMECASL